MQRMYGGLEDWGTGARSFGPCGDYGADSMIDRTDQGFDYGPGTGLPDYASYEGEFGQGYERQRQQEGEHIWHGGALGWLGSGLRASAAWIGQQMQRWGALLGGTLQGRSAELGRAMRGRGERIGSAMERRGDEMARSPRRRGFAGRPSRSYRRPDDRILDDVHQRLAMCGVDADEVEIEVSNGIVTLSGRVPRRLEKRIIEEVTEQVFGVQEVQNHLRLARRVEDRSSAEGATAGNGEGSTYRGGTEARG